MDYPFVSTQMVPQKNSTINVRPSTAPKVKLKGIAFPTEHGAWGMVFEPIVAALAVAFSVGGIFIAVAFVGAFLMRQPLRVLMAERAAGRRLPQGPAARRFFGIYSVVFLAGAAGSAVFVGWSSFLPLFLAAPLALIQIHFDSTRQSRRLAPELAGAVAISSSAAVIALAAGWRAEMAVSLWIIMISRSVPSIFYVRERLLLEKRKPFAYFPPVILSAAAALATAGLAIYGLSPWLVVLVMTVLAVRAALGLSRFSKRRKAMQIGVFEVVFGTLTAVAIVLGYYLHL